MPLDQPHDSAAHPPEHVAAPVGAEEVAFALRNGPMGALIVASIAVAAALHWLACFLLPVVPSAGRHWLRQIQISFCGHCQTASCRRRRSPALRFAGLSSCSQCSPP